MKFQVRYMVGVVIDAANKVDADRIARDTRKRLGFTQPILTQVTDDTLEVTTVYVEEKQ